MNTQFSLVSYNKHTIKSYNSNSLADILAQVEPETVTWLTVNGFSTVNRVELQQLLDFFEVDPILVNDILDDMMLEFTGEHQNCLYLEYNLPLSNTKQKTLTYAKGSLILGRHFFLLLDENQSGLTDSLRQRILAGQSRVQEFGPDYLLYLIIRAGVSSVEHTLYTDLSVQFEALEDEVIANPGQEYVLDEILNLRDKIKPLYNSMLRLVDVHTFIREDDSHFITTKTRKLFDKNLDNDLNTLWDGYLRLRDWTNELLNIHRANVAERTNRVIHILTIISTIFLPITFIASLYGMNFRNIPALHNPNGFTYTMIAMGLIVIAMLVYMKWKKWF